MKRIIFKILIVLLLLLEVPILYFTFVNFVDKDKDINKVNYKEQENIKTKSTLAYYLDGEPQENRNTWPTDLPNVAYLGAECYDENNSPIESSDVVSFNYKDHIATITTKKTVYCALYFGHKISLDDIIQKSEESGTLETEETLTTRNETITGNVKDDLRRFVGDKDTVTDNFICFGTLDQQGCKDNMDLYMYRIIGVDTEGRLKLIKATKLVQGSSNTQYFEWHNSPTSNTTWQNADLYKRLNGKSTNTSSYPNIFIGNKKYSYMKDTEWTKLIDTPTYYIGDSTSYSNPTLFQNERTKNFTGNKIGLMYLSDYLYANNGQTNTSNWLFIQNGLNGKDNTPTGSIAPSAFPEWTMIRYGAPDSWYYAWNVNVKGSPDWGAGLGGLTDIQGIRPVFFLQSNVMYCGTGDIENPYIILGS